MKQLPKRAASMLIALVRAFRKETEGFFRPYGSWRRLTNNEIWMLFLYQVVVVGGSAAQTRLEDSPDARKRLAFGRLRRLSPSQRRREVHRVLRKHGVRYVRAGAAKCLKSKAVAANLEVLDSVPRGPKGYLERLVATHDEDGRARQIAADFSYIKLKGSRDLMAELGLAKDVIAFDVRLINLLKLAGVRVAVTAQSNAADYTALQGALLRDVASPAGVTGVQLDRILFNNYAAIAERLKR